MKMIIPYFYVVQSYPLCPFSPVPSPSRKMGALCIFILPLRTLRSGREHHCWDPKNGGKGPGWGPWPDSPPARSDGSGWRLHASLKCWVAHIFYKQRNIFRLKTFTSVSFCSSRMSISALSGMHFVSCWISPRIPADEFHCAVGAFM